MSSKKSGPVDSKKRDFFVLSIATGPIMVGNSGRLLWEFVVKKWGRGLCRVQPSD